MAEFPPRLADPSDPGSIAQWAREITELLSGQLSIGEPVAVDYLTGAADALRPNGTVGNVMGSFVSIYLDDLKHQLATAQVCTHNLNIPNKGVGTGPTDLNVGWVIVRAEHSGAGLANINSTISCNYETGDAVTANSIALRFYADGPRTVTVADPLYITLWFFPATI